MHRLEYCGYDSAGVALINKDNGLKIYKKAGKVRDLEQFVKDIDTKSFIGMGHTRWERMDAK